MKSLPMVAPSNNVASFADILRKQTEYLLPFKVNMATSAIVTDPNLTAVLKAAEQARSQCDSILALIAAQKDDTQELEPRQKKLSSSLATVRGLNRKAILDVRRTKQDTADARHEVDTLHLQLQNLYYEMRHLNGEIAVCEGYEYVLISYGSVVLRRQGGQIR
jgi:septal ring factor EnvC (AmiA/AmiB activator)